MSEKQVQESLPGTLFSDLTSIGENFEPGTAVRHSIYVPCSADRKEPLPVYVLLEYNVPDIALMFEDFFDEGLMPPGMLLFVWPGVLSPTLPDGADRNMRAEEFDQNGPDYPNFLVEELIPAAARKADVTLSPSPDMHLIAGRSSGGMCAWNAAWYRNDYFRRVFLSSPTFSAMRGGEETMVLVRKTEARPIRIYMTAGTREPDYFFGSSFYAACNAAKAFEFAGYDFKFDVFPNDGHCCHSTERPLLRRVMGFLWSNWQKEPVRARGNQIRINQILASDSPWEETQEEFPAKALLQTPNGTYSFNGEYIYLTRPGGGEKEIVAAGFGDITAIGLSSDRWRLYIADRTRRFIYAMSVLPDGTLLQLYKLAPLHLAHDCRTIGALDLCLDQRDRTYAATELGIQGIVSFGLTDLILPLPEDLPADRVAWGGPDRDILFAASGTRVFKRKLKVSAPGSAAPIPPQTPRYGDGFDYSLSHLPQ